MTDAVQLLFLGPDGNVYGVAASANGNGAFPVSISGAAIVTGPIDLEQIKGVAVVTGGIPGTLAVGGTSAANAADDGSNPSKVGSVFMTSYTPLTNGQRGMFGVSSIGAIGVSATAGSNGLQTLGTLSNVNTNGTNTLAAGNVATFNTTQPTFTTGQYGALQMTSRGEMLSAVSNGGISAVVTAATDGANSFNGLVITGRPQVQGVSSTSWNNQRDIIGAPAAGTGVTAVAGTGTSAAAAAVAPSQTTASAGTITLKGSAGNLYDLNAVGAAGSYLMLFDGAVPADGAVQPKRCWIIPTTGSFQESFPMPIRFNSQISAVLSSTGPFTKTALVAGYISGLAV